MEKFKTVTALLSVILLATIVWFSSPIKLLETVSAANKMHILVAFVLSLVSIAFRVLKWKILIGVSYFRLFPVQLFGITLSNFTPGKVGEPVKCFLLRSLTGIPVSRSLPTVIWERAMDIIVLISFSILFLNAVSLSGEILRFSYIGVGIFFFFLITALFILTNENFGKKIFGLASVLPFLNKVDDSFITRFYVNKVENKTLLKSFVITTVPWLIDALILYIILLSLNQSLPIILLLGVIAISTIIGVASSLPGGIGSMEAVASLLLVSQTVEGTTAVATVLLFRAVTFWFGSFLGGLSFVYLSKKIDMNIPNMLKGTKV